jgi:transcriptional regulator with XRE-family HTH domain
MRIVHRQYEQNVYNDSVTEKDINKMVGTNLQKLRKAKGFKTQEALARKIDSSANLINAIENGKKGMGPDIQLRLINTLKIHPKDLYEDSTGAISLSDHRKPVPDEHREAYLA